MTLRIRYNPQGVKRLRSLAPGRVVLGDNAMTEIEAALAEQLRAIRAETLRACAEIANRERTYWQPDSSGWAASAAILSEIERLMGVCKPK
jgi:hypothetical protein